MLLNANTFPLLDMDEAAARVIRQTWGAPELRQPLVRDFLELGGRPLLRHDTSLVRFMGAAMAQLHQNLHTSEPVPPAFSAGALLYASAFSFVCRDRLPIVPPALDKLGALDAVDFTLQARDTISRFGTFNELLASMSEAIGLSTSAQEIVQIGAGAVHLAVIESHEVTTSLADYEADPDFADLRAMFDAMGEIDT